MTTPFADYSTVSPELVEVDQLTANLEEIWPEDLYKSGRILIPYLGVLVNEAIYARQTPPVQHTCMALDGRDVFQPFAEARYWQLYMYFASSRLPLLDEYKEDPVVMEVAARQLMLYGASRYDAQSFSAKSREELIKLGRNLCMQAIKHLNDGFPAFRAKLEVLRTVYQCYHRLPRVLFDFECSMRKSILPPPPKSTALLIV